MVVSWHSNFPEEMCENLRNCICHFIGQNTLQTLTHVGQKSITVDDNPRSSLKKSRTLASESNWQTSLCKPLNWSGPIFIEGRIKMDAYYKTGISPHLFDGKSSTFTCLRRIGPNHNVCATHTSNMTLKASESKYLLGDDHDNGAMENECIRKNENKFNMLILP